MKNYGKYGKAAIEATKRIHEAGLKPCFAWLEACKGQFSEEQKESIKKSCPRGAYLGLCEEGRIKGVGPGDYTKSKKSKMYALEALRLLQSDPSLASSSRAGFWRKVRENAGKEKEWPKKDQDQMDVVLALWSEGFIKS